MEIEVGEYVRTEDGYIFKVLKTEYDKNIENCYKLSYHEGTTTFYTKEQYKKIKHSKDIIDLIDIDDYVNGSRAIGKFNDENGKVVLIVDTKAFKMRIYEEDIKSIVTKEAFENAEYKV